MLISFICFAFITSPVPTWVMIFINFILIIREFLLIKFQKSEYFLDLWNLIDFALIKGIFLYWIVDLTEMQIWFIFNKEAIIIIMVALCLRFLFYMAVVRRIRYLVIVINWGYLGHKWISHSFGLFYNCFYLFIFDGDKFDLKLQESFLIALRDFNLEEINLVKKFLFIFWVFSTL